MNKELGLRSHLIALTVLLLAGSLPLATTATDAQEEVAKDPDMRPAGEVYQNIETFQRMPRAHFDRMTEVLNTVLGVECTHCHIQDQWDREDVEPKQTARKMFRMVGAIRNDYFEGDGGPACWTCHRGSTEPQAQPPDEVRWQFKPMALPRPSPFVAEDKPAGEVYENLKLFQQVPSPALERIMTAFTQWLGVECSFCHVEGQWASDEKEQKQIARMMFGMRADINQKFFEGAPRVGCWTCHRGSKELETNPPRRTSMDLVRGRTAAETQQEGAERNARNYSILVV